jgi:hypothetical protein
MVTPWIRLPLTSSPRSRKRSETASWYCRLDPSRRYPGRFTEVSGMSGRLRSGWSRNRNFGFNRGVPAHASDRPLGDVVVLFRGQTRTASLPHAEASSLYRGRPLIIALESPPRPHRTPGRPAPSTPSPRTSRARFQTRCLPLSRLAVRPHARPSPNPSS